MASVKIYRSSGSLDKKKPFKGGAQTKPPDNQIVIIEASQMKTIIEIPTHWVSRGIEERNHFDHPSLLHEDGTLRRLLESLSRTDVGDTPIVIIPSTFHPDIEKKVNRMAIDYDLNITIFSEAWLKVLKKNLDRFSPEFSEKFGVLGYSACRNVGLMIGAAEGAENIVFLDDDVIVEDEDFLKKAVEFVDMRREDKIIGGIAGYYINPAGSYKLEKPVPWPRLFWKKEKKMNEAFSIIDSGKRLKTTTIALGGNVVINRRLFTQVPFDPWITRGEDIDLLINAKHFGFEFLLDRELSVRHLHPERLAPWSVKMRQDMYRFFYEREKMRRWGVSAESLDPYPGFFMRGSLGPRAFLTSLFVAIDSLFNAKWGEFEESSRNIYYLPIVINYAKRNVGRYEKFRADWAEFMRCCIRPSSRL